MNGTGLKLPPRWEAKARADDLDQGHRTQVWLAASDDAAAKVTGEYFYHMRTKEPKAVTRDVEAQERLIEAFAKFSGVKLLT